MIGALAKTTGFISLEDAMYAVKEASPSRKDDNALATNEA
jgi:hypothetical protein